ncbi:hypothetical protein E2C01_031695 [Portunus trituberculatus]|uniref:Uncharacterized protein n=1 Tax=Portunus trituberculatus TaxID=210409 RepID=A0A5B7EU60_PORTR|nr:hypothetical protein [Portunus trituberculatus]
MPHCDGSASMFVTLSVCDNVAEEEVWTLKLGSQFAGGRSGDPLSDGTRGPCWLTPRTPRQEGQCHMDQGYMVHAGAKRVT